MLTLPALLITSMRPPLMENPFIVFLGAVILSALFGGLAPAFVTTALSALLIRLFFIEPRFSLYHRGNLDNAEQMGWFLLVALMLSSLVSALRRERNLIRNSEERYRILAETASEAIVVIDEQENILFVNRIAEELFGQRAGEMLGKNLTVFLPEKTYQPHLADMKRHLDTRKKPVAVQLPARHYSGSPILLEMTFGTTGRQGKNLFTAIVRDITGLKPAAPPPP
jgi:PAS domain S-box-containing protein